MAQNKSCDDYHPVNGEFIYPYHDEDSHNNISINTHGAFPEHPKYFNPNDPFDDDDDYKIEPATSTSTIPSPQSTTNSIYININVTPNQAQIEPCSMPKSPQSLQINFSQDPDDAKHDEFRSEGTPMEAMNSVHISVITPNAEDPEIPTPTNVNNKTPNNIQSAEPQIIDKCEGKQELVSPSKPEFITLKDGSDPATRRATESVYTYDYQPTRDRGYTRWMDTGIDLGKPWTIFSQLGVYFIISCALMVTLPPCDTAQTVIRSIYWSVVGLINFIWLFRKYRAGKYNVCMVITHILKLIFQIICVSPLPFICLPFMDEVLLDIIILIAVGLILFIYVFIRFLTHIKC